MGGGSTLCPQLKQVFFCFDGEKDAEFSENEILFYFVVIYLKIVRFIPFWINWYAYRKIINKNKKIGVFFIDAFPKHLSLKKGLKCETVLKYPVFCYKSLGRPPKKSGT